MARRSRLDRLENVAIRRSPPRVLRWAARRLDGPKTVGVVPGWHFGSDVIGRDRAGERRWQIWEEFLRRDLDLPVRISWLCNTKLDVHLGNDLSRCIYVGRAFEPNEFAFLASFLRSGMTFIDVGANEGAYSVFAAAFVGPEGRVIAIEPSRREARRLTTNIRLNRTANITVVTAALGSARGSTTLAIAEPGHGGQNTVGATVANENVRTVAVETVQVRTLDDVVLEYSPERVDVVKVDAEGSELNLLRGSEDTLSRFRPLLQLEVEVGALARADASTEEVVAELERFNYAIFVFDRETGMPRPANSDDELSGNVIALPKEKSL